MKRIMAATAFALIALSAPALANAPHLNATCPTGITVKVNKGGVVRINGEKAQVKEVNSSYWEATHNGVTISISKDASGLIVNYTGKGGANGICQVLAEESSSGDSGTPSKDEQACLKAVSTKTNNKKVKVLDTTTSEANNTFIIGVGEEKAKWKCLVKDGKVADVMSLTDEGAL